jgi:hypothetical protein
MVMHICLLGLWLRCCAWLGCRRNHDIWKVSSMASKLTQINLIICLHSIASWSCTILTKTSQSTSLPILWDCYSWWSYSLSLNCDLMIYLPVSMIIICQVQALHHRWEKRLCLLIVLRRLETSSDRSVFSRLEGTLTFPYRCMLLLRRVKVIVHACWLWRNVTRACWGHLMKTGCLSLNCITCGRGCLSRQITSRFQICLCHHLVDS